MDGAYNPRTVEEVFRDYKGRRAGLITALTTDVEDFYQLCDPEKENLCLYGRPCGRWKVNIPTEDQVPPEIPEPALGINFARDGMQDKDWLALVAVHSDSWLISVAFYFAARFGFDKSDRERLFGMINELPTVSELVKRAPGPMPKDDDEEDEYDGETLCGACGENYASSDELWICCDICEKWFHGKCVEITPARAEHIKHYMCPSCRSGRWALVEHDEKSHV